VVHEFGNFKVPVLLIIGDKDNTAPGKQYASPELRAKLGNYPVLAKEAVARMPQAKLVEFPDLGHSPQIQDPALFHKALLAGLVNPAR
jgi:pimeloyl-ACP methyl ester carboxylesterase